MQEGDRLSDVMKEMICLKKEEVSYMKGRLMTESEQLKEKIVMRLDGLKKAIDIYHYARQKGNAHELLKQIYELVKRG